MLPAHISAGHTSRRPVVAHPPVNAAPFLWFDHDCAVRLVLLVRSAAVTVLAGGALALGVAGAPALADATLACGTQTQGVIDDGYAASAQAIYQGELASPEVKADLGHVTSSGALARALAAGDQAAVMSATHALVYHLHWHIVRLRVLSSSGQLLADVGGPYVLAPVAGQITYKGSVVGRFLMSVQDDLGYEKLITRFTGVPIELYSGAVPLMGRDFPAADVPSSIPPTGTAMSVGGAKSVAVTLSLLAFPSGRVSALLAVPAATRALSALSCVAVTADTYGSISKHLARRLNLRHDAGAYVGFDNVFDPHKLIFLRVGARQIGSTNNLPGPVSIPRSGPVSYNGQSWLVYSFASNHSVVVYLLFPDGTPSPGATGATGATSATGAS